MLILIFQMLVQLNDAILYFKCPSCSRVEEIKQSMKEAIPVCQRCINASCGIHIVEMKRVYGHTGKPQFKGEGFYETDYKEKPK